MSRRHYTGKGGGPTPFVNAFDHPQNNSLRYNTSHSGSPIPLVWGCQRCTVNLISAGKLQGGPHTGFLGFKGGPSSGGSKKSGNYTIFVQFAVCHGPISNSGAPNGIFGNNRIWANGGVTSNLGSVSLNGYTGTDGQAADPAFNGLNPTNPGYSGTAHVDGAPMHLGSTPAIPDISFEITGFRTGTISTGFPGDANPALIILDILTDPRVGMGMPSSLLDPVSWGDITVPSSYASYCQAWGLAMSLIVDKQQPANRWIDEILQLTVAGIVWTGYNLKIIPYSIYPNAGNDATFTPDSTPIYSLTDLDFIPNETGSDRSHTGGQGGTDPVTIIRKDPTTITNWLSVEYMSSVNAYNPDIAPVWLQGLIDRYGVKTEPSIQAHEITNAFTAAQVASLILQRKAYILKTFQFKLGWRYCLLEPMDIVLLTDPGNGLVNFPVRITKIEEDDGGDLNIEAEEIQRGYDIIINGEIPPIPQVNAPSTNPNVVAVDQFADPGASNPPILIPVPTQLTGGVTHTIWLITTGGPDWGGAGVWTSNDDSSYGLVGNILVGCRQGYTTADLTSYGGVNPDLTQHLFVDLSESAGDLLSGTSTDASTFVTLCVIQNSITGDFELISYQNATLAGTHFYDLDTLYRGVYGTPIMAHPTGALFGRLDGNQFSITYPASLAGSPLYVKLTSFNRVGLMQQDLASVPSYGFVLP